MIEMETFTMMAATTGLLQKFMPIGLGRVKLARRASELICAATLAANQ